MFNARAVARNTALIALAFIGPALAQQNPEREASRRCLAAMVQTGTAAEAEAAGVKVISLCDCVGRYVGAAGNPNNQAEMATLYRSALQICMLSAIDEASDRSMRQLNELGRALGLQ